MVRSLSCVSTSTSGFREHPWPLRPEIPGEGDCEHATRVLIKGITYVVLIRVAAESVTSFLTSALLVVGLKSRCDRVGVSLETVSTLLEGRLLRVGLDRYYDQ